MGGIRTTTGRENIINATKLYQEYSEIGKKLLEMAGSDQRNVFQMIRFRQQNVVPADNGYHPDQKSLVTHIEWNSQMVNIDSEERVDVRLPGEDFSRNYSVEEFIIAIQEYSKDKEICEDFPSDLYFQYKDGLFTIGDVLMKTIRQICRVSDGRYKDLESTLDVVLDL